MRGAADLSGLDRAGRVDLLRSRMAAIGGGQGAAPQPDMASPDVLPVHPELAKVLPGGGLERRAVAEVSDCPALIVELIGQVTARGGHVGVVGWPELSLAGVVESGRLDNVITVPDPGTDPLGIVGILVEGLDLVVARWAAPLELSPVRARPLLARLRGGVAALVLVGARIPSPAVRVAVLKAKPRPLSIGQAEATLSCAAPSAVSTGARSSAGASRWSARTALRRAKAVFRLMVLCTSEPPAMA